MAGIWAPWLTREAAGVDCAHVVACLLRSDGYAAGSGLILRQVPADSRLL
jgi:hypothetical protein